MRMSYCAIPCAIYVAVTFLSLGTVWALPLTKYHIQRTVLKKMCRIKKQWIILRYL